MPLGQARSLQLRHFALSHTAELGAPAAQLVSTPLVTYLSTPVLLGETREAAGQQIIFPVVVDSRGAPWPEACLFLYSKIHDDKLHVRTCISLAKDLALYRRYLDEESLDYRFFPPDQYKRVTYRYRGYLKLRIGGDITVKTARRKMSSVISFYKWLKEQRRFVPDNPPWKEKQILIQIDGGRRKPTSKLVKTTDLAFKGVDPVDISLITDGGKLRPLSDVQQDKVLKELHQLGNSEMWFAHIFALFSGARIQTVLTMRANYINTCVRGPNNSAYIKVGPGTGVDTKFDKCFVLMVPWGIVEMLKIYLVSDRYKKRAAISSGDRFGGLEYLFLSNRGEPYYRSGQDPGYLGKMNGAEGAAIRQFICDRVRPLLEVNGEVFSYRFHDLRASFAMNLYNGLCSLSGDKRLSDSYIREYIRFRLGHASEKALDSYMSFNVNNQIARQAQLDWEQRLDAFSQWKMDNEL